MEMFLALLCMASAIKVAYSVNECKNLNNNQNQINRI